MIKKIIAFLHLYTLRSKTGYFEWDNINQQLKPYGIMLCFLCNGEVKVIPIKRQ